MALVQFKRCVKPQDLTGLNANTIFFFTDTQEIYMGGKVYGIGNLTDITGDITSLETAMDAINLWKNGSDEEGAEVQGAEARITALEADTHTHSNKSVLDGITAAQVTAWDAAEANATAVANAKVASVTAADNSVTIGGTSTDPTVAVKINPGQGNAIEVTESGLKVEIPATTDYTLTATTATGGDNDAYAKRYILTQSGVSGFSDIVIDIPKDMVVESGQVVTVTAEQAGTTGYPETAGTYIKLVLANADADTLWIDVANLIEYVTSGSQTGDMVVVAIDAAHQVTASITDGTLTYAKMDANVKASLDKADSALQEIAAGSVTKAMLESSVQTSLGKADSALQETDITAGSANGTITVGSKSVAITGLGSAAYTDSTAYATATQGDKADTALQPTDITEGSANGTIAVNSTNVAVHGLGSAAYTDATAYATATQGSHADDAYSALTWQE